MRHVLPVLALVLGLPAGATPSGATGDAQGAAEAPANPLAVSEQGSATERPLFLDDASPEQLARLDHVDAGLAARIVALRDARGGHIATHEELRAVPGMTASALQTLRERTGVTLSLTAGNGKTYDNPEQVLAEFADEPTVQQVQGWTNDYARTSPEMLRRWSVNAQSFAALPRFQAEYWFREDLDQRFQYTGPSNDLAATPSDLDQAQDYRVLLRAQWELSELVMSSDRIRIINESQDAVKLRDKLLTQVTRLYFDRRRHQVEMLLTPRPTLEGQVEDQLRLLELTAGIDALTGGRFSQAVRGGGMP